MNLLSDAWLPVIRRSGERLLIRPAQITDRIDDDPIVGPAASRPDFDGAVLQFLVGLLQTAFAPTTDITWGRAYDRPPTPDALDAAFSVHHSAFELSGDGPRFMQDLTLDSGASETTDVRQLLIDAPGENTLKNNADLFVRAGTVEQMGEAAAALALFTLQTNAPGGGAGHRTGLRGGGPLTTMLTAGDGGTLWETCWLNVLPATIFVQSLYGDPGRAAPADVFPWLGETRTSEKKDGRDTTAVDVHPAHVYWAMPRRIRLRFDAGEALCDVDGSLSSSSVRTYVTVPWGTNYTGPWRHPLTPAVFSKQGERINRKMNEGGLLWRHWPALTIGAPGSEPAPIIAAWEATRARQRRSEFRLLAFGYDMDNMKARCWYRAEMPLIHVEPAHRDAYRAAIHGIVDGTGYLGSMLRKQVIAALGCDASATGSTLGTSIGAALWRQTEAPFYEAARALRSALEAGEPTDDIRARWHRMLSHVVPRLFDEWIDIDQRIHSAPEAVVEARKTLLGHLFGKKLREMLGLPTPAKTKTPKKQDREARR